MESCNRNEERVCTKKGKDISIVKRRERREVCKFIEEQLREEYIRLSKLP